MIGVLIVVILGALGITVWRLVGGERSASPGERGVMFQCMECKHQFPPEQIKEQQAARMEESRGGFDCPKCGAKQSCYQMIRCPKCGKYYLSEFTKHMAEVFSGKKERSEEVKQWRNICPDCKTDREEYLKEKRGL
ncbi:MAG: hypothetical protein ACYTF6_03270 [Planctomycetota bacterium]|jgi:DNA-directed RNA polymerase subunit RPC12/RpoP